MDYDARGARAPPASFDSIMSDPRLNYVWRDDGAGGHRMAWWQWGPSDAAHVVVCVHGLSRQGRDFDMLARALLARSGGRLRIVCPDVVGRGRSDWLRDPMLYQLPTYAADMLAMLGRLHLQAPVGMLDWVGTSMGGLIGLALAGTPGLPLPVPLRRLVLNDVGPVIQWQALARIGSYLGKAGVFASPQQAVQAMRQVSQGFGPHSDAEWLALSIPMLRPLPGDGWTLHYDPAIAEPFSALDEAGAREGEARLWALYDAVQAQTLLLRGAQSDLLSPATAAEMALRGPRARCVTFAGIGHAPTLVAPDQRDAVCDFLLH